MTTKYWLSDALIGLKSELGTDQGNVTSAPFGIYIAYDTGEWYVNTGSSWSKVGQLGIPVDGSGNVTVGGTLAVTGTSNHTGIASFGAAIKSTNASLPTPAYAAGAGTSPPAFQLGTGANDTAGSATWGTGTSTGAGDQFTLTYGTAYAAAPKAVIVMPANAATAAKGPLYVSSTASVMTVGLNLAPTASQGNTVYACSYLVIA